MLNNARLFCNAKMNDKRIQDTVIQKSRGASANNFGHARVMTSLLHSEMSR
jgi:hypothetical protein